eukprot:6194643-Pleurochrysis_carterae.AAC.1
MPTFGLFIARSRDMRGTSRTKEQKRYDARSPFLIKVVFDEYGDAHNGHLPQRTRIYSRLLL